MGGFGARDSPSAGVQCVYTLSVVTVVGLGLVSLEVWERAKCEVRYGADYVCEIVEKRGTRETPLQFHLIVSDLLALRLK